MKRIADRLFPGIGLHMFTIPTPALNHDGCFQGSTDFYNVTPEIDRATPSHLEARLLKDNVGVRRNDGTLPPWMEVGDPSKSPIERYVEWFIGIWMQGDPSSWNATVFTNNAVTIDPSGVTTGAQESASNFLLLFKFFPELRGEVVSWAANDREIFINWRLRIPNKKQGGRDYLVPVCDKFCFADGRVSFRLAYFDVVTLVGHLSKNCSANELLDYLIAFNWKSLRSGGIPFLPKMLVNLFHGLFVWPPGPKSTGLSAIAGDRFVILRWTKVPDAISYKVYRATSLQGPYEPLPIGGTAEDQKIKTEIYYDRDVKNGTQYWYLVNPLRNAKPATRHNGANGRQRT